MPIVRVEMWEGRTLEQKRELVEVFTREMSRICGCTEAGIHIVIDEVKKENWAMGGQLCHEKFPDPPA
ncbi:2-hydroxymuconate tautomerase [Montanilutibacter psychrotolerans]|uniref:Tautomerase n=1 Tax=Montanilutibacter psychrotolerans TaxID=1327343 RepID=A0A3M8SXI3_9GAMM|nr:2-hydroxymuconate tautomerase [Lysobacter psychrotolerans]RNF86088.1 4-oxalocrotonate tautomerase [Lysobacter psychrotolerans]